MRIEGQKQDIDGRMKDWEGVCIVKIYSAPYVDGENAEMRWAL